MLVDDIISEICNLRIEEVSLIGDNTTVDPHFSRVSPLDRRDSLFIYL